MPIVMAKLAKGLADVFRSQPDSGAMTASKIAQEYDLYCKPALAAPGMPIFTGAEKKALEGPLAAALSNQNGTAAMVAQAFSMGIQAYWLAPPVIFSGGPASGVVTAMPGAAAVIAPLTAAFSNLNNTEDTIGQLIAAALDAATKTVLVTYATPPPPTGPPPPATVV